MTTSSRNRPLVENRQGERRYEFDGTNRADARAGADGPPDAWAERSRLVLTPVAAPSILGLFGFFAATLLVGSHMAGWWGTPASALTIFPFAVMLGGIAQFAAGLWAYRARDGLATAMHGIWGAFWMAYGLYHLLVATGSLPAVTTPRDVAFGFWFVPLAAITALGALGALAESLGLFAVLGPLAAGSVFAAVGFIGGVAWCLTVAGWVFVFSAGFAWYLAGAMMLEGSYGRTVLPTGKWRMAADLPGRSPTRPVEYAQGMPGARAGQ